MRKRCFFLTISILSVFMASAGDLERAFKYINTGEYDKALQSIRDELHDDPKNVAANFAMAKLFSSKDFKQYNIDSATIYINKSYAVLPLKSEDKQTKKYLKLGVRDFTIKELFDAINKTAYESAKAINSFESFNHFLSYSIDSPLNTLARDKRDEIKFEELKITENIEALKDFLNHYPQSKKYKEADDLYEQLLYASITKYDTYQSYKEYIDKYPTGPYAKNAQVKYEQRLYESYIRKNKLDDYIEFDNNYPKSPYRLEIQDSIYTQSTRTHMTADYNDFIKRFPSNHNIMDAWNRLFDLYTQNGTDSDYAFFQKLYPNNPLKERIQQESYLSKLPLAPFKSNGKYGYVNTATQVLSIEPQFAEASDFSNGLAAVALKPCGDSCYYSYIDKTGKIVFDKTFTSAGDFDKGKAIVATAYCDGDPCQYGIINRRGEFIVNPIFEDIQTGSEGLYAANNGKAYGFIDETGKAIIPFTYQDATPFSEGIAGVQKDSTTWIFIDHSGQRAISNSFKNISPFSSGLAAVTANDSTYGYINKSGIWAIEPTFEFAEPFTGDTAIVTIKDKNKKSKDYGLSFRYKIDKSGNTCYKLLNPNVATLKKPDNKKKKKK